MTTSTSTYTYTIAHTATYLSEVIMGEIGDLLATLGIVAHDAERWDLDQRAITAWIVERSLKQVDLECHRPDGRVRPIFQFPIIYRAGHEGLTTPAPPPPGPAPSSASSRAAPPIG